MELIVLGSSSKANGYILHNKEEAIIIECGCSIDSALKALEYKSAKVKGVLVTHEHGDHSKYIEKYMEYFPVYCSQGTADNIKYKGVRRPKVIQALTHFNLGGFDIFPFDTQHDCAEPFGFYISHQEIGNLLFATDTYYLKYKFPDLTNIMIECNYCDKMLKENVDNGIIHPSLEKRTIYSHLSLSNCINTLKSNNISNVNNIVLLHLSSRNSESDYFQQSVEKATHKRVSVAKKGLKLVINKTPF